MSRNRSDVSFTFLAGTLFLLLAVAAMLFVFLVRAPASKAAPNVSVAKAIACPVGAHVPVCYQFVLTNVGSSEGQFGCRVHPADGTSAVFDIGASTYVVPVDGPLPVDGTVTLTVLTDTLSGSEVAGTPQVGCDPIP
jgi:hypothetical protein